MTPGRFIVIEPSIKSEGGHYLQYAKYVLRAAADKGFKLVLACHKEFPVKPIDDIEVVAAFTNTFWHRYEAAGRSRSTFSQLCQKAMQVRDGVSRRFQSRWYFSKPYSSLGIWFGPRFSDGKGGKFAWNLGWPVRTPWRAFNRWLARNAQPPNRFEDETERAIVQMAQDLVQLHARLGLKEGDEILMATVSGAELEALVRAIHQVPELNRAKWHMVLRRNLRKCPVNPFGNNYEAGLVKDAATPIADENMNVRLYTDTEALTYEHNVLLEKQVFTTLPIPHVLPRTKPPTPAPYVIAYLGDARMEKGFQHLSEIVETLTPKLLDTRRARFRFQANFNNAAGDPECVYARNELQAYPADQVELISAPQEEEAYWNMIEGANLVLVLYDHNNYSERSSGIFAECIGMETPVIVPAGTWMSRQVCRETHRILADLFKRGKAASLPLEPMSLNRGLTNPLETRWFVEWQQISLLATLVCPPDAGQAIIHVRIRDRWYVRVQIDQRGQNGELLTQQGKLLEVIDPEAATDTYFAVDLQPGTASLQLQFFNLGLGDVNPGESIGAAFIDRNKPAVMAGLGEVYFDVSEIPSLIEKIVDAMPAYQACLAKNGPEWRRFHSGPGFMEALRD